MKKHKYFLIVLILFVISCAGFRESFKDMNPTQKITYFMGIYNRQYEDYKVTANRPDLSEEQKKLLREKRRILTSVYPLIQAYDLFVSKGNMPNGNKEEEIIDLLLELEQLIIE